MDTTTDSVLGGAVRLRQPARGLPRRAGRRPAGRGLRRQGRRAGARGRAAASARRCWRRRGARPEAAFTGVERDADALALAQGNIALNRLGERVRALAGDVGQPFGRLGLPPFDAAMANPPFFDDPAALRGPAPARARRLDRRRRARGLDRLPAQGGARGRRDYPDPPRRPSGRPPGPAGRQGRLVPDPADPSLRRRAGRPGAGPRGQVRQGAASSAAAAGPARAAARRSTRPRRRRSCAARRLWTGSKIAEKPLGADPLRSRTATR